MTTDEPPASRYFFISFAHHIVPTPKTARIIVLVPYRLHRLSIAGEAGPVIRKRAKMQAPIRGLRRK
jgi:hypothetical protein